MWRGASTPPRIGDYRWGLPSTFVQESYLDICFGGEIEPEPSYALQDFQKGEKRTSSQI